MSTIALRPMLPADIPMLASIMRDAVEILAADDYHEAQRAAWIDALESDFAERVTRALTLVAMIEGVPVGFASLADNTKIDLLFTDPPAARRGVATALCDALERLATARGTKDLLVEASDTAKPLFDARSFVAQRRNTVTLGDEWLANTTMKKSLGSKQ